MKQYLKYIFFSLLAAAVIVSPSVFSQEKVVTPESLKNPVVAPDVQTISAQYKFDGAWYGASNYDASEIGPNNFQVLDNMRYGAKHPEGIQGYSKINTTAIATYDDINTGIQLRTNRDTASYVLVHSDNDATGRVYYNTTAIPSQGDFVATQLHTDASGAGDPRFSIIPRQQVAYSNGAESYIWAGNQMDVAKFYLCDDTNLANPRDYWDAVKDTRATTGYTVTVNAANTDVFTVHSTRPLKGVWFTVSSVNSTSSTLSAHVWTSSGWVAVSNPVDGTADGGVSFAQSGEYTFDSTVATAARKHFENTYLFCYRFQLSAGSAVLSHVQADAPWQPIVDVWDGVPRMPIYAGIDFGGTKEDFTGHVQEASTVDTPIGLLLDGLTSTDEVYIMFEDERMAGIRFTMLADLVNAAASVITVKYWDGDSWESVANQVDGTLDPSSSTKSFNQSGLVSWTPPSYGSEFKYTIGERTGYCYQLIFTGANITGTHGDSTYSVVADVVTGIPAPIQVGPYKFHSMFKGRHLGVGLITSKEGNRVDFTPPYAPDVWNGAESSMNGLQSIYFGTDEDLTCGSALFNRYGSNVFEVWVGFTNSKMYVLKGDGPEEWLNPDTVASNIGCPAPYTLVSTATGYDDAAQGEEQLKRFALIWVSASGPYKYDGNTIDAIPGIERYFDPNDDLYVGADLTTAHAWYDPIYREYNLVLPGSVWVTYDIEKKKWYKKDTGTGTMVKCGFNVVDTNGYQYVYGGLSTGYMMRLEYGNSWDGAGITQKLVTGDFWPSENIWHETIIKKVKLVAKQITEDNNVQILYRQDTSTDDGASFIWRDSSAFTWRDSTAFEWRSPSLTTLDISQGTGTRLVRKTVNQNLSAWAHSFGFQVTTSNTDKGFQPIGWGIQYEVVRDDN